MNTGAGERVREVRDRDDVMEEKEEEVREGEEEDSGLVLALPALVVESPSSPAAGQLLEAGSREYENLAPTSQYYEQVQFLSRAAASSASSEEDNLYSIPQVALPHYWTTIPALLTNNFTQTLL